jgi:hypothetical protein
MNVREHWAKRAKRVRAEREATAWALSSAGRRPAVPAPPAPPLVVTLTRVGPSNGLDDDNLAGALKGVRDEVAKWLGVDDRDRARVRYAYEQERGREWAVRVEW